jgi:hypothetical protein
MDDGYLAVSADDRSALTALCMEYCWRVDNQRGDVIHELFAERATWSAPGVTYEGIDAIRAGWARRAEAARSRLSRHLVAGLRFVAEPDGGISGVIGFTLFAGLAGQVLPPEPKLVGEHHDRYVRERGRWLFAERKVVPIFPSDWRLTPEIGLN